MMVKGSKSKLMKKACALALGIVLAVSQAGLCVLAEPSETYNEVENEVSLENESDVTEEIIENDTEEKDEIESDENSKKDDVDENFEDEKQAAFDMTKSCGDVTVLLSAPEGVFPKGAYFEVREVSNSEEKNIDEAISEIRDDSEQVAASYTYDITVYDKDGNEIEPNTEYGQVSVTFSMDEATDSNLEAKVYHIETSEDELLAEELETSVSGDEVTALTDGFSYYTVEFTYGDKLCYVLNGDEKTELITILEACGIDVDGEITEAVSSNTDLFKGVCEDGVWFIYALKPFHTEETLKVTVNGKVYTIKVTDEEYKYWDPDNMDEVGCPEEYTSVEYEGQTELEGKKCYFVRENRTVAERIVVKGSEDTGASTYLILCDGAKLTANKGIYVGQGKGLYIYAQGPDSSSAMGALEAVGETNNAGIGGNGNEDDGACGTIEIYGGNITARGGGNAAGIGGGNGGSGTSISINGGKVTAQGGDYAAGIGSGNGASQSNGSININRGTVIADGGVRGAGIGGGASGDAGNISILGGNVTAKGLGPQGGAGIGSGYLGRNDGSITISGGTVDATGGPNAAGIGAGMNAVNCEIIINGGNVTASGAQGGAGIGSGFRDTQVHTTDDDTPGVIGIYSGTVVANGDTWGAGIGGGGKSKVGNINITGGEITATGGNAGGAGIGSGKDALSSCTVKIDDGEITATGGSGAAGIGSGDDSPEVTPNIDRSKFKYISFEDGKVVLSQDAEVNPVVQPKDSIGSSYRMEQEEAGEDIVSMVSSEPLLNSFSGKAMSGLCTFEKQGPLCAAVFKAATPLGFFEAFSFNLNLDVTGKTKPNYGKKAGKFVLNIPKQYRKKGRTFAIIGIGKPGKVKIFYDTDINDETFTTDIDIEGYAFSLIYTDLPVKKTKNTTLN